jgi:hypothetical protein
MAAATTDIVERIRGLRYVHVPVASELMNEAAVEVERLRWRLQIRENIIGRLVAENGQLRNGATCPHVHGTVTQHCSSNFTLTDEEREAIGNMIHLIECQHEDYGKEAHTLRKLLDRLHT